MSLKKSIASEKLIGKYFCFPNAGIPMIVKVIDVNGPNVIVKDVEAIKIRNGNIKTRKNGGTYPVCEIWKKTNNLSEKTRILSQMIDLGNHNIFSLVGNKGKDFFYQELKDEFISFIPRNFM